MMELDGKNLNLRTFRFKLLSAKFHQDYSSYLRSVLSKSSLNDIYDFFDRISDCLNFLDYGLLDILIHKFGSEDLRTKMKSYASSLDRFRNTTKVTPFVQSLQRRNLHPNRPKDETFKELIEILDEDPNNCTLEHLNVMRTIHYDKLRELSLSQVALMVLNRVQLSCVKITWLLLSEQVDTFKQMFELCIEEGTFFDENNIIHLELDGRIFMSMEKVLL